jgi:hypothetical protein
MRPQSRPRQLRVVADNGMAFPVGFAWGWRGQPKILLSNKFGPFAQGGLRALMALFAKQQKKRGRTP